jgi:hypothetical protein
MRMHSIFKPSSIVDQPHTSSLRGVQIYSLKVELVKMQKNGVLIMLEQRVRNANTEGSQLVQAPGTRVHNTGKISGAGEL